MKKLIIQSPVLTFVLRFMLAHAFTYMAFGILFMVLSGYFEYFQADALFNQVMKSSDALSVRLAVPAQVVRGALLALAIYPFREVVIVKRLGWLKLFFLLFTLTGIGSVITGPGSIEGFLYTKFSFNPLIGYPEISLQMLAFSWIFCRWQDKKINNVPQKTNTSIT